MRKYFKGVIDKDADGWMLAVVTGNSAEDGQDYVVDTNYLKADEVPDACNDAATFSRLVAGLLNCYYNGHNPCAISELKIIDLGTVIKKEEIPSTLNAELPF